MTATRIITSETERDARRDRMNATIGEVKAMMLELYGPMASRIMEVSERQAALEDHAGFTWVPPVLSPAQAAFKLHCTAEHGGAARSDCVGCAEYMRRIPLPANSRAHPLIESGDDSTATGGDIE